MNRISMLNIYTAILVVSCITVVCVVDGRTEDDATIRAMISADYPSLATSDDWASVNIIRQWAYEHTAGSPNRTFEITTIPGYYQMSPLQMYNLYMTRTNSAWCGGTAYSLEALYRAFGYEANYLGSGNETTGWTHATTLVYITHNNQRFQVLEDGFFNVAITNPDGTPMPYKTMLAKLTNGDTSGITITEGEIAPTGVIDVAPIQPSSDWIGWYYVPNHTAAYSNGRYQYLGYRALAPTWVSDATYNRFVSNNHGRPPIGNSIYLDMLSTPFWYNGGPITSEYFVVPVAIPTATPTTAPTTTTVARVYTFTFMVSATTTGTSEADAWATLQTTLAGTPFKYVTRVAA